MCQAAWLMPKGNEIANGEDTFLAMQLINNRPAWRFATQCLWTAVCLAAIESLILAILQELAYFAEVAAGGYGSAVEGISTPISILSLAAGILVWRMIFGFVPTTALLLFMVALLRLRAHWTVMGVLNIVVFLAVCVIWESQLHLLEHFRYLHRPLYHNMMYFLVIACFSSPRLLMNVRKLRNVMPLIMRGEDRPALAKAEQ